MDKISSRQRSRKKRRLVGVASEPGVEQGHNGPAQPLWPRPASSVWGHLPVCVTRASVGSALLCGALWGRLGLPGEAGRPFCLGASFWKVAVKEEGHKMSRSLSCSSSVHFLALGKKKIKNRSVRV